MKAELATIGGVLKGKTVYRSQTDYHLDQRNVDDRKLVVVDLMLERAHLNRYLDFALSNEDVKNPKPDPEIYITAISHFGFDPQECLIVEDNENGIRAAQGSGAHVMIVSDGSDVTYDNIMQRINEIEAQL